MSATTGTIGVAGPHRVFRLYWLTALVLAGLVTVLGIWALAGRDAGPAPADGKPRGVTVNRTEAPPGFRSANGEMYPHPFVPIQEEVTVIRAEDTPGVRYGPDGEEYPRPTVATGTS
jgi:hypothetical protein